MCKKKPPHTIHQAASCLLRLLSFLLLSVLCTQPPSVCLPFPVLILLLLASVPFCFVRETRPDRPDSTNQPPRKRAPPLPRRATSYDIQLWLNGARREGRSSRLFSYSPPVPSPSLPPPCAPMHTTSMVCVHASWGGASANLCGIPDGTATTHTRPSRRPTRMHDTCFV